MGKRPLPLWDYRVGGTADPGPERPLSGDWRDQFATLYEAAGARGYSPQTVDDGEIWEIAAALGANRTPDDPTVEDGLSFNERRAIAMDAALAQAFAEGLTEEEALERARAMAPSWDEVPMSQAEKDGLVALQQGAQVFLPPGFVMPEGVDLP